MIFPTQQENHSLLHTILFCSRRCPISTENDRQAQGLTFFCYIVMQLLDMKITHYCKRTEINDYYYYYYY